MAREGAQDAHLSVYGADLLRERAARAGARASREGRPRRRFLRERRARLARSLLPTLVAVGVLTLALGILEVSTGKPTGSIAAAVTQSVLAMLLVVCAVLVPLARKRTVTMLALTATSLVLALLGWGAAIRLSGGASSPYLLVVALVLAVAVAVVPAPPRLAIALSVVGYAALLAGDPFSPPHAHLLTIGVGACGMLVARARHRHTLRTFLRVERLAASVARMRRMQEQLVVVEKLEAMRVLVGGIAHELNNALAVAAVSAQQASKLVTTEPAIGAIKRAEGGMARIKATVDRLRRFAMASEGVLEPADVGAMLDFALQSAIGRARSGVIVERDYEENVGTLQCHVSSLAEALFQIAKNAVEAMPGGGTIRAAVRSEGDRVILSLSDQGQGMAPEQLKRMFDPYWRASPKASKSGMGLSAAYGLVTSIGGSIAVDTSEGKGTTVSITMPRKKRLSQPPSA
jgi:signal transduction histidine kinase